MMSADELLREIDTVAVDSENVRTWDNEYHHLKLATDLMREAAHYTCMLGNAVAPGRREFTQLSSGVARNVILGFRMLTPAMRARQHDA